MTFAAHHIEQPLSAYYLDHEVLVAANLAVLEEFDLDIVQAISDPYRETADFGATIACMQLGGPRAFSSGGCEIPDGTPHENLQAQVRALRDVYTD